MAKDSTQLKSVKVSIKIPPFFEVQHELVTNEEQRRAAWSLYVELVTRVAVQPMPDQHGLLRETLSSLNSLFASTREILKDAGPNIGGSPDSVGGIAIAVLNKALRPFLSKWHPSLQSWEALRPPGADPFAHEKIWTDAAACRAELETLRAGLADYADVLAKIASVK